MILFDSDNARNEALKTTLFEKERLNHRHILFL